MNIPIIIGIILILGVSGFFLLSHAPQATAPQQRQTAQMVVSPNLKTATGSALLAYTDPSLPIIWQSEKTATANYEGKSISGKEEIGMLTYKTGYLRILANASYLKTTRWVEDINLSADGPNGSQWGYIKNENAKKQILLFSYMNLSFTPPPQGTTCPCEFTIKLFMSDPL